MNVSLGSGETAVGWLFIRLRRSDETGTPVFEPSSPSGNLHTRYLSLGVSPE
ncbi:MAG: hypothetical protein GY796_04700 [Chloroflexi bacterium]|nr:hypothetical protein [Chloroflexota bacterium]